MVIGSLLVVLFLASGAHAEDRTEDRTRIELYDAKRRRQGYVIVNQSTGRVDFYDNSSRRLGYGRIAPDGRVERFDINGKRDATGVVLRVPGR